MVFGDRKRPFFATLQGAIFNAMFIIPLLALTTVQYNITMCDFEVKFLAGHYMFFCEWTYFGGFSCLDNFTAPCYYFHYL